MPDPITGQPDPEEIRRNLAITLGSQSPVLSEHLGLPAGPQMAAPGPISMPDQSKAPNLAISLPQVKGPRGTLDADKAERTRLMTTGPGESQIYGKVTNSDFGQNHPVLGKILGGLGQVGATLGDIGISAVAPGIAAAIPGTAYHHAQELRGVNKQIGAEEGEQEKEAQTADLQAKPELAQAKNELAQEKQGETESHHQAQLDTQLRQHGFKHDEEGNIIPLPYAEMSEEQQGVHDLKASQDELAQATTALRKAQADPNSPQAKIAQQRVEGAQQAREIALQRLGLSQQVFNARYHGTDQQGNPLPGAMITDEGQPVGSSFSQNVRPTGTERNKADMAASAKEQLIDIKSIVQRHPTLFGPGYGQTSAFRQWLGSQDPDAQRFIAARTIAGDHLAGTFGGRSEAALDALDKAIGQFKDNPKAMEAGLDQLLKANQTFQKAGTVKTAGSKANEQTAPATTFKVKMSDAMALPQNKGKSEAEVEADVKKHGGEVVR